MNKPNRSHQSGRTSHRSPSSQRSSHNQQRGSFAALRQWRSHTDFAFLAILLILVALGGGSAFADTLSLIYVRLAAVAALVVFAVSGRTLHWNGIRTPLALLAVLAAIMVAQLIPLPPSLWTALPGRAAYLEAATFMGQTQPWRPLSLTPDLTINSLVALVVPISVLIGFAKLTETERRWLVIGFVILGVASMALGVAQVAGGANSALYTYKRTYEGTTVGLLANRNHQGALLAALFPALRVWTLLPSSDPRWTQRRFWLAVALGIVTVPVLLATGSRAGILLGIASLIATFVLFAPRGKQRGVAIPRLQARLMQIGIPVGLAAIVFVTWRFGRAMSIQRLTGGAPSIDDDLRFRFAPFVIRIIKETFPAGTGFGSFDPIFRQYEPDSILIGSYFNHAHNELLEVLLTAGAAGAILLAVFSAWWIVSVVGAFRDGQNRNARRLALLGAMITGILMAGSLVDYPLRTPLLEAWFAIGCGWLSARRVGFAPSITPTP